MSKLTPIRPGQVWRSTMQTRHTYHVLDVDNNWITCDVAGSGYVTPGSKGLMFPARGMRSFLRRVCTLIIEKERGWQ